MAIKRLHIDPEIEAFVLAISCHHNNIKLAWEINRALNCELAAHDILEESIYFINKLEGQAYFRWKDPSERVGIHLFSNRGENSLLVPSQKEIDYFLVITGFFEELDLESGIKKIRNIDSVLTAFPINLERVKK